MKKSNSSIIVHLIKDVHFLMKQNIKSMFDETGFTAPQIMVMANLSKHGSMRISELSEGLNLSNSTISGIVDRLEKNKYVERIRSQEDRRVVLVSLTKKSQQMMHEAFHERIEAKLDQKLVEASKEDVASIIYGLETLKKLLEK